MRFAHKASLDEAKNVFFFFVSSLKVFISRRPICTHYEPIFFSTGWLYEASGSYHQAFFVCGSVSILSSLFVFIVSRLDRDQRRRYTFQKHSVKTADPGTNCVCEESAETGSEMCALVEMTSREVLVVTDRETVL